MNLFCLSRELKNKVDRLVSDPQKWLRMLTGAVPYKYKYTIIKIICICTVKNTLVYCYTCAHPATDNAFLTIFYVPNTPWALPILAHVTGHQHLIHWVIPEKIHTSPTDGTLEILVGGGVECSGNPGGREGLELKLFFGGH